MSPVEPRARSVLFGVAMPEPGAMTAGQRWTAALAVILAAVLLVMGEGAPTLVAAPPADTGASSPPPAPATEAQPPALPPVTAGADAAIPAPPFAPVADDASAVTEPTPEPEPPPTTGGDAPPPGSPPPPDDDGGDGGGSGHCPEGVAPVLAIAGLCPGPAA